MATEEVVNLGGTPISDTQKPDSALASVQGVPSSEPQPVKEEKNWEEEIAKARASEEAEEVVPAETKNPKTEEENDPLDEVEDTLPGITEQDPEAVLKAEEERKIKEASETDEEKKKKRLMDEIFGDIDEDVEEDNDDQDLSNIMRTFVVGGDDAMAEFRKSFASADEIRKALNDPNSFLSRIYAAKDLGMINAATNEIQKMISEKENLSRAEGFAKNFFTRGKLEPGKDGPSVISGKKAQLATIARLRGVVKVPLLNSGFWIILRPTAIGELTSFLETVQFNALELGHTLGSHMALVVGVFLKEQLMMILEKFGVVEQSNLVDFDRPGVLSNNISYHDYDSIVAGLLEVQYMTTGIRVNIRCPKCQHEQEGEVIDPKTIKFVNYDLMSSDVQEYWNKIGSSRRVTSAQLKNYRALLDQNRYTEQSIPDIGKIRMHFCVPTMSEYIKKGKNLIDRLNNQFTVSKDDPDRARLVGVKVLNHLYQMFIPWFDRLDSYNLNGEKLDSTTEQLSIEMVLEADRQEENLALAKDLNQFISDTKFTWYGTTGLECPGCGSKPYDGKDNFTPIDVESLFFALSYR